MPNKRTIFVFILTAVFLFPGILGYAAGTLEPEPETNSNPDPVLEPENEQIPAQTPEAESLPEQSVSDNNIDTQNLDDTEETDDTEEADSADETEIIDDIEAPEDVFRVILPTSAAFDFVLDPQGLLQIEEGESIALDELDGGRVFTKIDIPAVILNESSVPIRITVEIAAISSAGGGGNDDKAGFMEVNSSLEEARAAVHSGDGHNILLYIAPSEHGISSVNDGYEPTDLGFIITEEPITLTFDFPRAEYILRDDGSGTEPELIGGTGSGTQLNIGGYINRNANWVNFTANHSGDAPSTISLIVTFSWYVIEDSEVSGDDGSEQTARPGRQGIRHFSKYGGHRRTPEPVELDEDALSNLFLDAETNP